MKSPVNWALLGLIIERESYAYELAQRFQSIYHNVLSLSSISHIYTALGVLQERSFIEQLPGTQTGRQPKPNYRATALGVERYGEWLVDYVREDRRRQVMFVLGLSSLAANTHWVTEILDRYDRAWLEHDGATELFAIDRMAFGPGVELTLRILSEENELIVSAKRAWVRRVRQELEGLGGPGPRP